MRHLLTALILTASAMGGTGPEAASERKPEELKLKCALEQEWSELIVSMLLDEACLAPRYVGFRISQDREGLTIAAWRQDQRGQAAEAGKPLDAAQLPKLIDATLRHYAAALASKNIFEEIDELETQEEREYAMAAAFEAAGRPIGGFSAVGIDVRLISDGRRIRFENGYGNKGFGEFHAWLTDKEAVWKN